MNLYVYNRNDYAVTAVITGDTKEACERKAQELGYDNTEKFGTTVSPNFGTTDGLRENPVAREITA